MDMSIPARWARRFPGRGWRDWPATWRHLACLCLVVTLLGAGTLLVYLTGGTAYAFPYLMLLPVMLAAAGYGRRGALLTALVAGLLMAAMPLEVATGERQSPVNWLVRLGLYLLIGGVAGWLFTLLRNAHRARELSSRTDPFTGLPNQVALHDDLSRCLAAPARQGKQTGLILLRFTDLSEILEAIGVDATDDLVAAFGTRLRGLDPSLVEVYRFNGEEVALLFQGIDQRDLDGFARRIAEAGEENLMVKSIPVRVQLVLGSSLAMAGTRGAGEMIREARVATFAAQGRQRLYSAYSPDLRQQSLETIQLVSRVRQGLAGEEFELHYQPKLRLSDGRVCGCEGLIRWRKDDGALIPPGSFMPKLENTSLIAPVTAFVIAKACELARAQEGIVSINFAVRNLFDDDLLDELGRALAETRTSPERLEIEITESALMHDMGAARRAVERLRDMGLRVSIDDFGTGFASFEYLQYLPVTGLKIDRAFVRGLGEEETARKLMACLIDVGHALGLTVVAEGVETLEQHHLLRALGCDQAQGFLYSGALTEPAYLDWWRRHDPKARTLVGEACGR
ncbi:EAL domain-containing protein [Halomonas organivorans]